MLLKNYVVRKSEYNGLVKNVYAIKTIDTSNLVKKLTITQKLMKLKKNIADHDHGNKYITTQEFNKLTAEHFASRLAPENFPGKNDIAALIQKTDSDYKLKTYIP